MGNIRLHDNLNNNATCVPNAFIDYHMTKANGEYVKIFLYLMRCVNSPDCDLSVASIADHFDLTEKDVMRALNYWGKYGLLHLEYEDGALSGIMICQDALRKAQPPHPASAKEAAAPAAETSFSQSAAAKAFTAAVPAIKAAGVPKAAPAGVTSALIQAVAPERKSYTPAEAAKLAEQNDVKEIIYIAEQYLGRTLAQTDLDHLFFWYDELKLSADLVEYLIEHCVSGGHNSLYYMEKIALDLASASITEKEPAMEYLLQSSKTYATVMSGFGIRGRNLTANESRYLKRWSGTLGFSDEMIAEACKRTITNTHEASFVYADSILDRWNKQSIRTFEDLAAADEQYQRSRNAKDSEKAAGTVKFSNFKQRNSNWDELQKQLIQSSRTS